MNVLGYDVTEWVSIISILGVVIGFLVWLVKEVIMKPNSLQNEMLTSSIKELSNKVDEFSKETRANRELINHRLEEHDRRLDRHHERLKALADRGSEDHE